MKRKLTICMACILMIMNFSVEAISANEGNQVISANIIMENNKEMTVEITREKLASAQFMVEDSITDVNGDTFKIARPNPNTINKVNADRFGLSPENDDNYDAFSSAINYCNEHPNTYLELNKGIYHFRTEKNLNLNELNNILIDGNGSEFIFSTPKYFKINKCKGLEIRELAIEWDWEASRLASLVKISKCNKIAKTLEIEFTEIDDVDLDIPIICFMQFDKDTLTPGSYGGYKTFYPGQVDNGIVKREKVAPNKIKLYFGQEKYMNSFHDEEVYLIRHYTYGGRVFQPVNSENITFDDVHIYSAAGMGYIIGDNTKYFQIINSSIGRRTDKADAPYISTTADGIHILNTGGYFRIENCDFSFTGDDIINIHDDVMSFTKNEGGTVFKGKVTGTFVSPGDKVRFKNSQMGFFEGCEDYEVEVESFDRDPKTYDATITFKTPVDSAIGNMGYIYRSSTTTSNYVIKNNYIHETKGRGMLVLGNNALVENNSFYRTVSEGIHVLADVDSSGFGSQGCGVSNVTISGNTLIECTVSDKKPVIMVSYMNGNTKSEYKDILTNIRLEDNKLIGCYTDAIEVDNTTNIVIKNNLIQDSGKIKVGDNCSNITNIENIITTTTHLDTHDVILIQGRAPSCVSYGMKPIQYCNDCHRKLTEVTAINRIAHTKGEVAVMNKVDATCNKAGFYDEVTYCTECGQELTRETKEIRATGNHGFTKCVSNKDGTHKVVCADCGFVQEGHDKDACTFDAGKVTKEATETVEGSKTYTCSVCGQTKTEVISKKEVEKPAASVAPGTAPSVAPSVAPVLAKQTIKVTKKARKTVIYKASTLKKKKATLKLGAKAKTKLIYKVSKYPKKAKKYISVSKNGTITMKKGAKKGTYKVIITAKADKKYAKATKTITIKVK